MERDRDIKEEKGKIHGNRDRKTQRQRDYYMAQDFF